MPPPEPIGEKLIVLALYIDAHFATAGATSDDPAPFRVPADRFPAAPALVTASAAKRPAAARASVTRTSLPFLGMSFFLLLKGSRGRYGATSRGRDTPPLRGGDEVVKTPGARPSSQLVPWLTMVIDAALEQIQAEIQEMGARVLSPVHGAIRALEEGDRELAAEVIAFGVEVDNHFLGIEQSIQ